MHSRRYVRKLDLLFGTYETGGKKLRGPVYLCLGE